MIQKRARMPEAPVQAQETKDNRRNSHWFKNPLVGGPVLILASVAISFHAQQMFHRNIGQGFLNQNPQFTSKVESRFYKPHEGTAFAIKASVPGWSLPYNAFPSSKRFRLRQWEFQLDVLDRGVVDAVMKRVIDSGGKIIKQEPVKTNAPAPGKTAVEPLNDRIHTGERGIISQI